MALYKLNFPIETPNAWAHWESRHKLNRIKAIIAFSLDLDDANNNLRRAGYYRQYRKRYLDLYSCLVASPSMDKVPLSDVDEHWWDPNPICPLGPVTTVDVTVAATELTPTFGGMSGSGTATAKAFTKTGVTASAPTPATGLSNNDKVQVTVTAGRGYTVNGKPRDTFEYTVTGLTASVSVDTVTVDGPVSAVLGTPATYTAIISPATATNKDVTWTVSPINLASITNAGVLTVKQPGTVTVTATSVDGNKVGTKSVKLAFPSAVAPVIDTATPANLTVNVGDPISLNVSVTPPAEGVISYTWYKGNNILPNSNKNPYVITAAALTDAGTYHVIVDHILSNHAPASVVSRDAVVTVNSSAVPAPTQYMSISDDIESNRNADMLPTMGDVAVSPLRYDYTAKVGTDINWHPILKNVDDDSGVTNGAKGLHIVSSNTGVLTISSVDANSGRMRLHPVAPGVTVVTITKDPDITSAKPEDHVPTTVVAEIHITVKAAADWIVFNPNLTNTPHVLVPGETLELEVGATGGTAPLDYEWQYSNTSNVTYGWSTVDKLTNSATRVTGQGTNKLTITGMTVADAHYYRVVVKDTFTPFPVVATSNNFRVVLDLEGFDLAASASSSDSFTGYEYNAGEAHLTKTGANATKASTISFSPHPSGALLPTTAPTVTTNAATPADSILSITGITNAHLMVAGKAGKTGDEIITVTFGTGADAVSRTIKVTLG